MSEEAPGAFQPTTYLGLLEARWFAQFLGLVQNRDRTLVNMRYLAAPEEWLLTGPSADRPHTPEPHEMNLEGFSVGYRAPSMMSFSGELFGPRYSSQET